MRPAPRFRPWLLIALVAACEPYGGPSDVPATEISLQDNYIDQPAVIVSPNTTVRWIWKGANMHSVTFEDASGGAAVSSTVKDAGTFERRFVDLGIYSYRCSVHPDLMMGTIEVKPPLFGVPTQP